MEKLTELPQPGHARVTIKYTDISDSDCKRNIFNRLIAFIEENELLSLISYLNYCNNIQGDDFLFLIECHPKVQLALLKSGFPLSIWRDYEADWEI